MPCASTLAAFTVHDKEEYNVVKRKVSQDSADKDRWLPLSYIPQTRDGQTLASRCQAHSCEVQF